jgi:sirohydrochlorin cobaltochelatase
MEAVAEQIRQKEPAALVACAYLELSQPDLPTAVAALVTQGVQSVRIVPMFLGVGKHAREDLPVLVQALRDTYPQLALSLQKAVGENPKLVDLLAQIALESA